VLVCIIWEINICIKVEVMGVFSSISFIGDILCLYGIRVSENNVYIPVYTNYLCHSASVCITVFNKLASLHVQ